jgi:hypothetical protein
MSTSKSIWIDDIEIVVVGGLVTRAYVAPECYALVRDPADIAEKISRRRPGTDVVVFGQRMPEVQPKFDYPMEWEAIAVIEISGYDKWLEQIGKENRKNIAKAARRGVVVREVAYDDEFVRGIMDIYDESPVRQGKKFWHYGKDFETVKRENGTYADRSVVIGAYHEDELIGFVKMVLTEKCASTLQVISKLRHRDKKATNALIAKAVEICAARGIPYLQYGVWSEGTLGEFKARNGFKRHLVPMYVHALTLKGRLSIRTNTHHGVQHALPPRLAQLLKTARRRWHTPAADDAGS